MKISDQPRVKWSPKKCPVQNSKRIISAIFKAVSSIREPVTENISFITAKDYLGLQRRDFAPLSFRQLKWHLDNPREVKELRERADGALLMEETEYISMIREFAQETFKSFVENFTLPAYVPGERKFKMATELFKSHFVDYGKELFTYCMREWLLEPEGTRRHMLSKILLRDAPGLLESVLTVIWFEHGTGHFSNQFIAAATLPNGEIRSAEEAEKILRHEDSVRRFYSESISNIFQAGLFVGGEYESRKRHQNPWAVHDGKVAYNIGNKTFMAVLSVIQKHMLQMRDTYSICPISLSAGRGGKTQMHDFYFLLCEHFIWFMRSYETTKDSPEVKDEIDRDFRMAVERLQRSVRES